MNEKLEEKVRDVISRYYSKSKVERKVKELLETKRMMNNQGGSKYNKYYQFLIDGDDVYHRVVRGKTWPSSETFNINNKRLLVKWDKN